MIFVVYKEEFMKKSKIIVPALAILVLSTAASITGTVAWFTAQSTFTTQVGDFAVVRTNGDLECTMGQGLGTTLTGNSIATTTNYKLSDASFDHSAKYIIAPDRSGQYVGRKTALADANTTVGDEDSIVRNVKSGVTALSAMTFTMTFSLDFGAVDSNYALYFDASASSIAKANSAAIDNTDTIHGFRMAFVGETAVNTVTKVWADQQTSGNAKYVSNGLAEGAALAGSTYATGSLMDSGYTNPVPATSQTKSAAAAETNYLGIFNFQANTTVELEFTVVCWFEGSDPTIVDTANEETDFDAVRATLQFGIKATTD